MRNLNNRDLKVRLVSGDSVRIRVEDWDGYSEEEGALHVFVSEDRERHYYTAVFAPGQWTHAVACEPLEDE